MKHYDEPGTLLCRTRELLEDQDLLEVYKATELPFYWLRSFASGKHNSPSVNRVQVLYEHLTKSPLKISK